MVTATVLEGWVHIFAFCNVVFMRISKIILKRETQNLGVNKAPTPFSVLGTVPPSSAKCGLFLFWIKKCVIIVIIKMCGSGRCNMKMILADLPPFFDQIHHHRNHNHHHHQHHHPHHCFNWPSTDVSPPSPSPITATTSTAKSSSTCLKNHSRPP